MSGSPRVNRPNRPPRYWTEEENELLRRVCTNTRSHRGLWEGLASKITDATPSQIEYHWKNVLSPYRPFNRADNRLILDFLCQNSDETINWQWMATYLPRRPIRQIQKHWQVVEKIIRAKLADHWRVNAECIPVLKRILLVQEKGKTSWRKYKKNYDDNRPSLQRKRALRFDVEIFQALDRSSILQIMYNVSSQSTSTQRFFAQVLEKQQERGTSNNAPSLSTNANATKPTRSTNNNTGKRKRHYELSGPEKKGEHDMDYIHESSASERSRRKRSERRLCRRISLLAHLSTPEKQTQVEADNTDSTLSAHTKDQSPDGPAIEKANTSTESDENQGGGAAAAAALSRESDYRTSFPSSSV